MVSDSSGIDDFNRPVFKSANERYPSLHFGSVNKLFSWEITAKQVEDYFKDHMDELEFFGTKFNCEPEGGNFKGLELQIVEK